MDSNCLLELCCWYLVCNGCAKRFCVAAVINLYMMKMQYLMRSYKRLGKQRVEAYQLWRALMGMTKGWVHHPATLMWKGHTCFLAKYCNTMIIEWQARGYKNNMALLPTCQNPRPPWWWGWEPVIKSHQASLNRKMPDFYHFEVGPWKEWGYVWPSKVPERLRLLDVGPDHLEIERA